MHAYFNKQTILPNNKKIDVQGFLAFAKDWLHFDALPGSK